MSHWDSRVNYFERLKAVVLKAWRWWVDCESGQLDEHVSICRRVWVEGRITCKIQIIERWALPRITVPSPFNLKNISIIIFLDVPR